MPRNTKHYWFYNDSWSDTHRAPVLGYISDEDEAQRLATMDHLIVFQATEEDMEGLY